uniref:Uncharacterized protein n=1 Tax=Tetranychus urticae TaxID=32264 RepID=T1K7Z2_TETUR
MINGDDMIELKVSNYGVNGEVDITPLEDNVAGNDLLQNAQVKLIQLPSTVNVIQVPSNLLVSNNNLILCLPPEGITLQLQPSPTLDSSMEGNSDEIFSTTDCGNQPSFTSMSPITCPDIIQTTAFETNEVSPEVQLEKAQTWHKDSQLAIKALAALKAA